MSRPFIDRLHRVCDSCGKAFLSGVIHVQRGWLEASMCRQCATKRLNAEPLFMLSRTKTEERWASAEGDE